MLFKPHSKPLARIGPQADAAFGSIAAPEMRWQVYRAYAAFVGRYYLHKQLAAPASALLLKIWLNNWPGARKIEKIGLPCHAIEALLGPESLVLHVDPRQLIQFAKHPKGSRKRSSSAALIWDGDWDLYRIDLRTDYALQFIYDLDKHRHDLSKTKKYKELLIRAEKGKPYHSYREGFYLNTPERILAYLHVYLGFLDNMATQGYQETRAKDYPGVAITREGRLVKVRRGAHRLAMAQWLGLSSIPVKVQYIHRLWWETISATVQGREALERLQQAMRQIQPEQLAGSLSPPLQNQAYSILWPASKQNSRLS